MKCTFERLLLLVCAVSLTACGSGGGGGGDGGSSGGGGTSTLAWWNLEERSPAGMGPYMPSGTGPVLVGTTAWIGPVEVSTGMTAYFPSMADPDRSEVTCSTLTSTLVECLSMDYDMGILMETRDLRATPGAMAPTGSLTAGAGFFPGGLSSMQTSASLEITPLYAAIEIEAYVMSGGGLEGRSLSFEVPPPPGLVAGTYTVGMDLDARGFRGQVPLMGAATIVLEAATAGTMTITSITGTTVGSQITGTFDLTFGAAGTAMGTFDVLLNEVQ